MPEAYDVTMANLFPAQCVEEGLKKLIDNPDIYDKTYFCPPKEFMRIVAETFARPLNLVGDENPFELCFNLSLKFPNIKHHHLGIELHPSDESNISIFFGEEWKGVYGREEHALLYSGVRNHKNHGENFLSAAATEEVFKVWPPFYSWSDDIEVIIHEQNADMLHTPWLFYQETMVFGPELVKEYDLRNVSWGEAGCYYYKWLPNDVLWLASPIGVRSGGERLFPLYHSYSAEVANKLDEVTLRHYNAIKKYVPLFPLESRFINNYDG